MVLANYPVSATLAAADIDRARAFYRDTLGLELSPESPEVGALYECGSGTLLFIYPSEFAGTNQATGATWRVDDLADVVARLQGRGVVFEEYDMGEAATVDGIAEMPDGSKAAWFEDTEGNIIGLVEMSG
jgi:catechol 2,3-dioxygenase-like lactoylglutathione lyase family enzyme